MKPLFVLCCLLTFPTLTRAALDAEEDKPYTLNVVLHVAAHPSLTPAFQNQLQNELKASLQIALGKLAVVNVETSHPLLKEVAAKGLQQALDNYQGKEPQKTHFVLIDFIDDQYDIQTGQHDGLTNLATSVVRHERTADRQFVAKLAAQQVFHDFGLVGTVRDARSADAVRMVVKGAKLGVPFDTLLKKDDLFALSQVRRAGAQRVREAFLQVVEGPDKDGVCVCRLTYRYENPASKLETGSDVLGYRVLKLGSTEGPLRIRLTDDQGKPHPNLQVKVGGAGFDGPATFEGTTNREGFVQTRNNETAVVYHNVAFVRVLNGAIQIARIPVPILDDRVVICRFKVDENADKLALLSLARQSFIGRLTEAQVLQTDLFETLNQLVEKRQHREARTKAHEGLAHLNNDLTGLHKEQDRLYQTVKEAFGDSINDKAKAQEKDNWLSDGGRLKQLQETGKQLQAFIENCEQIDKQQKDAKERNGLIVRARLERQRANYDEAIKLYTEAQKLADSAELAAELTHLKEAWKLQASPDHAKARKYFYEVWPNLDTPEKIKEHIGETQRNFDNLMVLKDKLTLHKFRLTNAAHFRALGQLLATLPTTNEDELRKFQAYQQVGKTLETMHTEANKFVGDKAP